MAALLQGAATNKNKTALYLGEARRMGIQVLSPDVNESVYEYSAVGDVVRFGLGAIRNVGENAVKDIIAERETGRGKYVNFMDFIRRVPLTALNRRLVESLIKAGAFDSIDPNRRALFTVHESAIDSVVGLKRKQAEGQFDLFSDTEDSGADAMGDATVAVPDIEEWDKKDKLKFERDMLGLYVSDHPLSGMQAVLAGMREMSIAHLIDRAPTMPSGQQVTLAGLITNVDRRVSKKATRGDRHHRGHGKLHPVHVLRQSVRGGEHGAHTGCGRAGARPGRGSGRDRQHARHGNAAGRAGDR